MPGDFTAGKNSDNVEGGSGQEDLKNENAGRNR
jgi:hypothetical protein